MNQQTLNLPKWNIIAMLIVVGIGTIFMVNAEFSDPDGVAMLVVVWLPLMLGIGTLILYGLSRYLFKKNNWFITLLGALYILSACIQFYLG
jgi:hypothetical protein